MVSFGITYNSVRSALTQSPSSIPSSSTISTQHGENEIVKNEHHQSPDQSDIIISDKSNSHKGSHEVLFLWDILDIIFEELTCMDLLRCSSVCRTWHYWIMKVPGFWKDIKFRYRLVDDETIKTLICRQALLEYSIQDQGILLYTVHDKLELLMYSTNLQFIQKLCK